MRLTIDNNVNCAYIYIADKIGSGEVAETIPASCPAGDGYIFLDFDANGRLLGIEIIGANSILPG